MSRGPTPEGRRRVATGSGVAAVTAGSKPPSGAVQAGRRRSLITGGLAAGGEVEIDLAVAGLAEFARELRGVASEEVTGLGAVGQHRRLEPAGVGRGQVDLDAPEFGRVEAISTRLCSAPAIATATWPTTAAQFEAVSRAARLGLDRLAREGPGRRHGIGAGERQRDRLGGRERGRRSVAGWGGGRAGVGGRLGGTKRAAGVGCRGSCQRSVRRRKFRKGGG